MLASNRPLDTRSVVTSRTSKAQPVGKALVSVGSVVAALAASSCCVLPFLFFAFGISGAWIGNLTALAPYQPYFVIVTLGFLAAGFFMVYRKPGMVCAPGSYCAQPYSDRIAKVSLWIADRDHRRGTRVSPPRAISYRNLSLETNMRKLLVGCATVVMVGVRGREDRDAPREQHDLRHLPTGSEEDPRSDRWGVSGRGVARSEDRDRDL
jgi:mercuric ion transport protein